MIWDIGPDDFQPEWPPENAASFGYDPGSGDYAAGWSGELHGGGYDAEPGTDPFEFAAWMEGLLKHPRSPYEMLVTAPLHLLWVINR